MPQSYVYRMVAMDFKDNVKDSAVPFNEKLCQSLSAVDKQRLTVARSFFRKFNQVADAFPGEESSERQQEAKRRAEVIRMEI